MAADDVETFARWFYQPETESFLMQGYHPSTAQDLLSLSGGRFTISRGRIRNVATGRIAGNIATIHEAFIEVGSKGTLFSSSVVPIRQWENTQGTDRLMRLYVSGDLSPLQERPTEFVNRMITVAPRGAVIYVNDAIPSGKARYTRVDTGVFGGAPPPLVNEFGRLATAEDLVKRGVAGWLARNAAPAVERLKLQGMTMPDGTVTVNGSDIVNAIAATISVVPIVSDILAMALQD